MLSAKTSRNGVAHFTNVESKTKGFTPRLVTTELNDDFNYLDLKETNIETSRFDVGGVTEYSEDFKAFIYSPRNLYRPGEEIDITGIIRDENTSVVNDVPVITKIYTPTGSKFDEFQNVLNDEGSFELNFQMPDYAGTGEYRAEVETGAGN